MDTDKPNAACAATTDFGLRRDERKNFLTEGNQDFAEPEKKISSFPSFPSVQVRFAVLRFCASFRLHLISARHAALRRVHSAVAEAMADRRG
jgi:hypothetical protein